MQKKLRITILAVGSRGDMNPFCALARALKQAGYVVKIITHKIFEEFVTQQGIEYAPIAGDYKELFFTEAGYQLLEGKTSSNLISDEILQQQFLDAWEACQGSDAIIFPLLATWGYSIAEALNVPGFLAGHQPVSPTRDFPVFKFESVEPNPLKGLLNYWSYFLLEFLSWRNKSKIMNDFRTKTLGLPAIPFLGARYRQNPPKKLYPLPVLYQFSSHVITKPHDWSAYEHITGYWFLDENKNYEPPQKLVDFINNGSTPISIGFGSMTTRDPERLTNIILSALEKTKQRAVLLSGWAGLGQTELPDNVHLVDYISFEWLFPQMKAVVHHGGAGTTASGLRAGVPNVIVPFFADQPGWGKRLANLGVSPEPIPSQELDADKLAQAIDIAVNNEQLRGKAESLGEKIRSEDGLTNAVNVIKFYLDQRIHN
ncbi:MAG: glycosyltransferase [Scytonematopsis contorta HA4267-MV1]|jgi:UDP:flavonoid glycosyltransferase YjiC (YdhE family)|nr:glycosyltransferase [Scytonematopsis contorta HA4267-MV1]